MAKKTCYVCHSNEQLWPLWDGSETHVCQHCYEEFVDFCDLAQMMISEAYVRAATAMLHNH